MANYDFPEETLIIKKKVFAQLGLLKLFLSVFSFFQLNKYS